MQLYLRTTDPAGRAVVTWHLVWDADLFLAARRSDALEAAAKSKAKPARVELATEDDYREFSGYKDRGKAARKKRRP